MNRMLILLSIILPIFACCRETAQKPRAIGDRGVSAGSTDTIAFASVGNIPLPEGYRRVAGGDPAFAQWLLRLPICKDPKVYLYNGQLKPNQTAQFAVLDVPVGKKDLQQCADAVMRLRAEYFYSRRQTAAICFFDNNDKAYACPQNAGRPAFEQYLEKVYAHCGTLSLERQLKRVPDFNTIQPGDVLIKGGSPGHAVIVLMVAEDSVTLEKRYLLAQSYMPAQQIHILKNRHQPGLGPWYRVNDANPLIYTPEWTFSREQLRRW
ncbi:MAG: DUF4846 domain-containing protein [Candidatus Pseudobacter hemicellulosilyticus]|uniref:DUF4846 domain-containing protein n=1 Tax=Candidatus Pseudobacter hemicellulosilyticus TaxID=3121375 RepID=A0AAJ5WNI9_9BACT|nr:MAG: DUF4846 domain-containing protein [Pseudobacter sp.]